jgi:diguanylate cyclase (GGDEF)-like protein
MTLSPNAQSGPRVREESLNLPHCPVGQDDCAHLSEVARLRAENRTLAESARVDGLTGLYNYRHFQATLEVEMARARRVAEPMGLVMLDLDHFKRVNDRYGHEVGNRVLRDAAQRLRENVRRIDIPCRYGGEELAVVLPGARLKAAVRVAERVHQAMETSRIELAQEALRYTASLGVVAYNPHLNTSAGTLVAAADRYLYQAKQEGRNRVCHPDITVCTAEEGVSLDERAALLG